MEGDCRILQAIYPTVNEPILLDALVSQYLGDLRVDYLPSMGIIEAFSGRTHSGAHHSDCWLSVRGTRGGRYCRSCTPGHSPIRVSSMHRSEVGAISVEDSIEISFRMREVIMTRGVPMGLFLRLWSVVSSLRSCLRGRLFAESRELEFSTRETLLCLWQHPILCLRDPPCSDFVSAQPPSPLTSSSCLIGNQA